jgi:hypothetical protein
MEQKPKRKYTKLNTEVSKYPSVGPNGNTYYVYYERKKLIKEETIQAIRRDLKNGIFKKDCVKKYNLSQPTINKWLKIFPEPSEGIPSEKEMPVEEVKKEEVKDSYIEFGPVTEIPNLEDK